MNEFNNFEQFEDELNKMTKVTSIITALMAELEIPDAMKITILGNALLEEIEIQGLDIAEVHDTCKDIALSLHNIELCDAIKEQRKAILESVKIKPITDYLNNMGDMCHED